MALNVAIVGSGPAGYYTAEGLIKQFGDTVCIDIIDRLPTPFGLIRAGVAPDHQSIKAVARRFEEQHGHPGVRFIGNVELGRDIAVADLTGFYDAVVIATGAPRDRPLGIEGEGQKGVLGAAQFVAWYNAHPDYAWLEPDLDTACVAVIGNGNVAIDVARVLVKSPDEMASSDLARHAAARIHASPIRTVNVFGRRGPLEVSFTPKELGELGHLQQAQALADPAQMPPEGAEDALDPGQRKVVGHIRGFAAASAQPDRRSIRFHFFARPVQILGDGQVRGVRFERTRIEDGKAVGTGAFFDMPCGLVVGCIGYRTAPIPGVPYDERLGRFANDEGRISDGLYCVGWARRGPTGTIGTNRPDGFWLAERIAKEVMPSGKRGPAGLDERLRASHLPVVTFEGWKAIEAAEAARARPGAPREKFAQVEDMLGVAQDR